MFLARREAGKLIRVYPVESDEPTAAWPFFCLGADGSGCSSAALKAGASPGVAATGYTRAEALKNLADAESLFVAEDGTVIQ